MQCEIQHSSELNHTLLTGEWGADTNFTVVPHRLMLTVDLCYMSTTLHSDSDVDSSEALLAQQQHWLQKLNQSIE